MKYTTPASRAPGVPSLGIMHESIAATSLASAGVKNSKFCESGEAAALWACSPAARTSGQFAVAHVAPAAAKVRERNCLRSSSVITVRSKLPIFSTVFFACGKVNAKEPTEQNFDTD